MLKNIFTKGGHFLGRVKSGSVSATQALPSSYTPHGQGEPAPGTDTFTLFSEATQ
jgi:hypothetical protein